MTELSYNFKELVPLIKQTILSGRTPAIWGMPGIGKSALGRHVADLIGQEKGVGVSFYILDAPLLQPFDYAVGVPNHKSKKIELYPTGFLPKEGPAVVLVEDLPHAKPYQVIPLMQIVLDHRIGPHYFTENVWFIITGNREEDLANVNPLPSPLYNRLVHFNMSPDVDEWRIWGKGNGIDERILGFVYAYPQYFCQAPQEGVKAWPTPRSLHMLSDCIKGTEDENTLRAMSSATVGPAVTNIFMAWVKYLQGVDTDAIITRGEIPHYKDRSQLFAIVGAVASRLKTYKPEKIKKNVVNIVAFWRSLEGDYKISFLKELLTYDKNGKVDAKVLSLLISFPECEEMTKYVHEIAGL